MRRFLIAFVSTAALACAAAANAQDTDPIFKRDVLRLLEATNAPKITEQMMTFAIRQTLDMMRQSQTDMPQRMIDITNDVATAQFKAAMPDLLAQFVPIYAKYFTLEDVQAALAFYTGEAGKKFAALAPTLTQEGMQIGQEWGKTQMPQFLTELEKRLRAEGLIK